MFWKRKYEYLICYSIQLTNDKLLNTNATASWDKPLAIKDLQVLRDRCLAAFQVNHGDKYSIVPNTLVFKSICKLGV